MRRYAMGIPVSPVASIIWPWIRRGCGETPEETCMIIEPDKTTGPIDVPWWLVACRGNVALPSRGRMAGPRAKEGQGGMTGGTESESTGGMGAKDAGRYPWRPVIGQFFCTIAFYGPFFGISGILLPAKIGFIDPADKVNLTATATTATLIISMLAGIVFGAPADPAAKASRAADLKRTDAVAASAAR